MSPSIRVRGARVHNLRNVDVTIPGNALVAICGPSGSGKSSLAFDTIYAEAQRRFVDALSTYARQIVDALPRPDVDAIDGLSPAIALPQRAIGRSPRATLGTLTEIDAYLRLLFARVAEVHCPVCGDLLVASSAQSIVDELLALPTDARITLLAPIVRGVEGDLRDELDALRKGGFVRARIDGVPIDLGEIEALDTKRFRARAHELDVVVDRLVAKGPTQADAWRSRAVDSVELALKTGQGRLRALVDVDGEVATWWRSDRCACEKDGVIFPPITPRLLSFNSVEGACPRCEGVGVRLVPNEARIVDGTTSLRRGAIVAWGEAGTVAYAVALKEAVDALGLDKALVDIAFDDLSEAIRTSILHGGSGRAKKKNATTYEGVSGWIARRLAGDGDDEDDGALDPRGLATLCDEQTCDVCHGTRLSAEARALTIGGVAITDVSAMQLTALDAWVFAIEGAIGAQLRTVARPIVAGISSRARALREIGVGYLECARRLDTLSGGELQRVRMASLLGSELAGLLYVLDEPSLGLHPNDVARVVDAMRALRDRGGSVVVVEHDLDLLRACDYLVDVGPGAGEKGGTIVASGAREEIERGSLGITGPWLSGAAKLPNVAPRRPDLARTITLRGARLHTLANVDVSIPLGVLVGVTGVSGSGKSSLIDGTLVPAMRASIAARGASTAASPHLGALEGAAAIDRLIAIDQQPLGRSSRSSAATYTGIMDPLRQHFAALPEAKARGYTASRFSFNARGGRCEACRGEGVVRVSMAFLPDVLVPCEMCGGARFDRATLEVKHRGRSIADVLALPVDDALLAFDTIPAIADRLRAMQRVGLGYLRIGQPSSTLSGGEAQRVKLATELAKASKGARDRTLYLLDEPTTGLHPSDVVVLLEALVALRDAGSSVVVIEHDMDVVARLDWVIDLGPHAGAEGGHIVAAGTPDEVARSHGPTAAPLAAALARLRG